MTEVLRTFAGLDAEEDLRGERLRPRGRSGVRAGAGNGGPFSRGRGRIDGPSPVRDTSASRREGVMQNDEEEEQEQCIREEAWNVGMFARRIESGIATPEELATNLYVSTIHESARPIVQGLDLMIGLGNEQVTVTQGSDPFNLGPIIEKTMHRVSHGKKSRKNKREYAETILNMEAAPNFETTSIPHIGGIDGNMTVSSLKEQVKLHTPDMVLLLETKTRSHHYGFLKNILGINFMHNVEAMGLILVSDDEKGYVWRFFGVYASIDDKQRKAQWLTLQARISRCLDAFSCLIWVLWVIPSLGAIGDRKEVYRNDWIEDLFTIRDEGCEAVVAQRWAKVVRGPQCAQMHGKLIWVRKGLLDWKRREWRNSQVRIDALRTDLRAEYQKTEFDSSTVKEMEFNL
ncbi:unnamed protein product, partial [Prunus brigantina]